MLITSGQLGLDPATGSLPEGVEAQTARALENIDAILSEAGFTRNDVVKTTVYIRNMGDFGTVNEVYAAYFGEHKPARSCVEVSALPKNGLVEIEVTAVK
jgi:2-iminobutanoate/2-iminopropanoate deaminase